MSSRRRRARRSTRSSAATIALSITAALAVFFVLVLAATGVAGAVTIQGYLKGLPDANNPEAFKVAEATRIYSADGKLLARLYLENRTVVPMSKISTDLVDGVVSVEDERFYQHNGVDPQGIMRAALTNLAAGSAEEGASTITQQYVRNTILLNERTNITPARKVREAYLAMELEKRFDKREILHMYLNTIYFGEGAYGAEAASQVYFAKHANQLTLGQAALLAGLPQSPSRLDPYDNLEGALARRKEVLDAMLANGHITAAERDEAHAEPVKLKRQVEPLEGIYAAPFFVSYVKKELQKQYSPAVVFKGGLTVHTSIDMKMQKAAEKATARIKGKNAPEVALVAIDPRTGHVKAMVGGRDYSKNKYNLATQAHRQAGSSFKTFVLVTAIDMGMPPSYRIDSSSPAYIPTKPKPWVAANSEGSGRGLVTLQSATTASINTVFARLIWALGAKKVAQTAKRMGIQTRLGTYPSMALGAANVTPFEMASAYGTLATGGVQNAPTGITKVVGPDGTVIYQHKPKGRRVLRPEVAYAATNVLRGVISGGTARRAQIGRPAAGKTGTSQDHRDVWFVGYTPQLVTSVWVGHRQEKTIYWGGSRAFGGTVAAPIWAAFMKSALAGQPKLNFAKAKSPKYTPSKFKVIGGTKGPSVTGMSLNAAIGKLTAGGYDYTVEYVNSSKPKGTVVSVKVKGNTIVLLVSKGPTVKPPPSTGGGGGGGGTTVTPPPDTTGTPSP